MSPAVRTALVTGGSEGLGLHVARCLSEKGYCVTIVGRSEAKLERAAVMLSGNQHKRVSMDLATRAGANQLIDLVEREGFDVLVNNAGASHFGAVEMLDADAVEGTLQLNLLTPALVSWAFVRNARPGSVLVNVTSIVGTVPIPGNTLYSAAKAGLQVLTECLWYETQNRKIRVLDFRPAGMKTNFHQAAGGASMSGSLGVAPETAARDLVAAIEGARDFVYVYGAFALALEWMRRLLPKRLMIGMTGRKSKKAGYL